MTEKIQLEYPPDEFAKRDAIHIAILPAVAGEDLRRGQRVQVRCNIATAAKFGSMGIVNPFAAEDVRFGERLWVFVHPYSIQTIRHDWTHPDVDADDSAADMELQERWLRGFASRAGIAYDDMLVVTKRWLDGGDCWVQMGSQHARDAYWEHKEQFWRHYRAVTGDHRQLPEDEVNGPFSCSC